MNLIIDANVLFAALISSGKTQEILILNEFNLYAPEFIFEELEKYEEFILKKTHRKKEQYDALLNHLKRLIKKVPNKSIENKYLLLAKKYCPDKNDVFYFALALKLNCAIWSNDKKLKTQSLVKIYSTQDLVNEFNF